MMADGARDDGRRARRSAVRPAVPERQPSARRIAPSLVDFLRDALGSSELRPGDKLEPALRELLYLRVEHAGAPTRSGPNG